MIHGEENSEHQTVVFVGISEPSTIWVAAMCPPFGGFKHHTKKLAMMVINCLFVVRLNGEHFSKP